MPFPPREGGRKLAGWKPDGNRPARDVAKLHTRHGNVNRRIKKRPVHDCTGLFLFPKNGASGGFLLFCNRLRTAVLALCIEIAFYELDNSHVSIIAIAHASLQNTGVTA